MSNHSPKSTSSHTTYHIPHSNRGFTLIEMLIIAPIIILVIGIFVSAIISMTGDVLSVRGENALAFDIQDALNRIDQDVKSSGGYLATNNISLTSPQGYNDDDATNFHNADSATNSNMLILNTYATTASPLSSTRNYVYSNGPNACNSALVSQNQKVAMNIVYFVKSVNDVSSLWRRVIVPSNYETVGCSVPWQQPSCETSHVSGFCKTSDIKLVDGVSASGFVLNYYTSAAATTPIANAVNNTLSDTDRQTFLQTASSVNITISATKTLAGRDVGQSGTIRSISPNTSSAANSIVLSGSGGGTWAYKRPITITNSSGGVLTNYQIKLSLTTAALGNPYTHIKTDGSDVRFMDSNGTTEYPYWNEVWNNAGTSTIWVKIPSLATGDTTINMYYGNPSATTVSNGDNIFMFFDDFESGGLSKWTKTSGADTFTINTGVLQITPAGNDNYLTANTSMATGQIVIDSKIKSNHASGSSHPGLEWHANLSTGASHRNDQIYSRPHAYNAASNVQGAYFNGGLTMSTASAGGLYNYNTWYDIKVTLPNANSASYYRNGVNELNVATQQYPANTYVGIVAHGGSTVQWDNFRVRQFAATEPTHTPPGGETAL